MDKTTFLMAMKAKGKITQAQYDFAISKMSAKAAAKASFNSKGDKNAHSKADLIGYINTLIS